MKTQISSNIKFSDPKLEEEIRQVTHQLEELILQEGASNGRVEIPKSIGDSYSLYFSVHHSKIQNLIDKVATTLQPRTTIASVVQHQQLTKDEIINKSRAISDKQRESIKLKSAIKEHSALGTYSKIILIYVITVLIGLTEAFFALPIFESFGYSKGEAIIVSLLYGMVLTVFSHFVIRIINLGKTKIQRRIIAVCLAFFTIGLFTYLSASRVLYIAETAKASGFTLILSPVPFILMATLILGIAVAVVHFGLPSKDEKAKIKAQRDLILKDKALSNEIKSEFLEIEGKNQLHASLRFEQGSKIEYGYSLEIMLTHKAEYLFNLYKIENQKHRNTPCDCINEPYTLKFKYYFIDIVNKQTNNPREYEN